jgi:hypothetical protein
MMVVSVHLCNSRRPSDRPSMKSFGNPLYILSHRPLSQVRQANSNAMTDSHAIKVGRGLLAVLTMAVLLVTFYFPLMGLGYAMDASADVQSRWEGILLMLPSFVLLLFFFGLLPPVRGRSLLWLGIVANVLLLPPVAACVRMGFPAAIGLFVAIIYVGTWWLLAKSKLARALY